jgi:hypothetical protein
MSNRAIFRVIFAVFAALPFKNGETQRLPPAGFLTTVASAEQRPPATCPHSTDAIADGCATAQVHGTIVDPHLADAQAVIDLSITGGLGYTDGTFVWVSSAGVCARAATGTVTVVEGKLGGATRGALYSITDEGSGCTSRPTIAVPAGAGTGVGGSIVPTVYQLTPHNAAVVVGANWSVAGVDYPVGANTTLTFKDPMTGGLPTGCTVRGSTVTCAGSGGVLDGWDFRNLRLVLDASEWTITNSKFRCAAGIPGLDQIRVGAGVASATIRYNTFDGGASLGRGCVSGGLVANVRTVQTSGTLDFAYNLCLNADSKCFSVGSAGSGSLIVNEKYNYYGEIGLCGGGCSHGEAEYSYGSTFQTINWTLEYNVAINHYYSGPTNLTSEIAQVGDDIHLVSRTAHNYVLSQGTQAYIGNNNEAGQVSSAPIFCGHQIDPLPGSLSGTMRDSILDYSGAFFAYNPSGGTCQSDIAPADWNAGTGHACRPSGCN